MTTSVSKVKFMCSSGGKILPRPSDMKLRYVGGETRMISVGRNTAYNAFLDKMTEIYGPDIVFRYQLPEEDLDALVSVSCDEDLENMMEECDRLSLIGGSSKLRVFVFSRSDLDVTDLQDMSLDHKTSEQKFVDAVNAMAAIDITSSGMHNKFPVLAEGAIGPSYNMNDAYEVWNGVERQGRPVSLIRKNPQSDVWLAEGALPFETFHRFDDNPANHGPHPFHLLPQETIANQQHGYIGNSVSPPDSYNNIDMYSGAVGMNDFYDLENVGAAPSSQYEPKSKFLEDLRSPLTSSLIQPQEEKLTIYHNEHNDEERRDPGISMDFGINLRDRKLLDLDDFKSSDTQLHGDQFSLSPGAFLQKQLHENHHPVAKHSKNLTFADGGEPLATIDDLKQHEVNRKALNEHDGDYEWDRFPIYDASPASDLATTDIGGTLRTQSFIETEVNSLSSPSIEKIKYDRRLQQGIGGIHQQPLATNPAMISLDEGQQPDIDSQDFPDHGENTEKFIHLQWNPKDSFLSSENYEEDSLNLNNRRVWSQVPETYSDSSSNLIPSLIHKVDNKDFLTYVDRFQSQSIPYSQQEQPGKNTTHKVLESETENIKEASLSSVMDDFPALDMISNLLRSSSRADCIPAKSSTEGSLGSDKTGEGETGHLKLSGKATFDDRGLKMIHDALPSKEEFDIIMSTTFVDTLNEEIPREDFSPIRDTVTPVAVPCLASTPPITSLIDTWDECEKNAVIPQHVMHEIPGEDQIDLVSDVSKETVPEEYRVELEETDEFKSFGNVSTDPVALAEAEAISRGLQIIRNSDLEELRELGSGTFGTVYHGKWRGTDVAIKRIKASCFSGREADRDRLMADFWREAYILGKLHHPNVVAFYGVVPDGPGGTLATVTEYMVNGSLKQVLQSKDRTLDRRKRLLIAMDAAFGMEYLHAKNVVHFDIKCENLLVNLRDTQRPICKVADLGLSKVKQQTFVSGGVRGTLPWMAPELLNGNSNLVSEKVDVFSFGIVMWELLTGEEPYANMHYGAIIGGIVNNKLRPTVPKWCDVGWRSLMERCWAAEPADRPNFSEVAASLRAMEASISLNPKGLTFKQ